MLKSKGRIAAAGTAVAVATSATALLLLGGGSATAGTTAVAPANSVTGTSVADGSLNQVDINPNVINKVLRVPGKDAVTGWSVKDGSIVEADLSKAVKDKLSKAGTAGKSAYDLAKDGGYTGTQAEWLTSLKGGNGDNGKSAYEIAKDGGYQGTEAEWQVSLKGTNGTNGTDGKDGKDGANGTNGVDGKDGAAGKDGAPGKDGVSGYEVETVEQDFGPGGIGGAWCKDPAKVAIAGGATLSAADVDKGVVVVSSWPKGNAWEIQLNKPAGVDPGTVTLYAVCVTAK